MASVEALYGFAYGPLPITEGAGAQAFKKGDLIKFSSGTAVIATSAAIDGIAAKDATGTTGSAISYYPIKFDELYVVKYSTTTAVALVGTLCDFDDLTVGAHTVTTGGTTDTYCVALDPRDAVGATGGRLIVKFMPAATLAS